MNAAANVARLAWFVAFATMLTACLGGSTPPSVPTRYIPVSEDHYEINNVQCSEQGSGAERQWLVFGEFTNRLDATSPEYRIETRTRFSDNVVYPVYETTIIPPLGAGEFNAFRFLTVSQADLRDQSATFVDCELGFVLMENPDYE